MTRRPLLPAPVPMPTLIDAQRVFDGLHQPVWVFDIDHSRIHWANRAAIHLWQSASLDELCRRDLGPGMSDAVARRLRQYQADFERDGRRFAEQWTLYPAGRATTLWVDFSGLRLPDGRMVMLCEARPQQVMPPDSLRSVEALLHTQVMTTLYSRAGQPLYRNPAARESVAHGGETLQTRLPSRDDLRHLVRSLVAEGACSLSAQMHTVRGLRWHELSARLCRDAVTGRRAVLVTETDISELKEAQARAQYLADHDALTGLPNRNHVTHHYPALLQDCARAGREVALIFIDLDHFKRVNDSLGHAVGDQLLVELAMRLRASLGTEDRVARLGGDEFLVLLCPPAQQDARRHAQQHVEQLLELIARPIQLLGTELRVTPSIGMSLFPHDGTDIDTLMRHADLAMYSAKSAGRNLSATFRPEMNAMARSRLDLEVELRRAFARGDIQAWFQPRVEVTTGRLVGAEALARWRHPERGLIPPDVFVPICEDCGLIADLGAVILEQAAAQRMHWARAGHALTLSVNLSPRQFFYTHLIKGIDQILQRTGCPPHGLELEITESVLLGHDEHTVGTLKALGAMGLAIAIDDFGTGYSNLAYLHRYPVNTLKIDRSFIHALSDRPAITEMIVAMSQMLGVTMVAEGVETPEQLAWLRGHGVHEYQGWLFGPAVPAADFAARWLTRSPRPPGTDTDTDRSPLILPPLTLSPP